MKDVDDYEFKKCFVKKTRNLYKDFINFLPILGCLIGMLGGFTLLFFICKYIVEFSNLSKTTISIMFLVIVWCIFVASMGVFACYNVK